MLSEGQQILLHAWLDGEATGAEMAMARELLARPQASQFVAQTKRLRALISSHARVNAPAELIDRVRQALQSESTGARVFQLFAWRSAIVAAAAAVMVAAGLTFGPGLWRQDTPREVTGDVAVKSEFIAPKAEDAKLDGGRPMDPAVTAPSPPAEPRLPGALASGDATTKSKDRTGTVLRLDRGLDQPFELSVHMDRRREASTLQVYNDMLIVSSLYGDAELKDSGVENEADFAGRDFSEFDGVSVEVESDRVPELIAALNRMTADQAYGTVVVPNDLRQSIAFSAATVSELQGATRKPAPQDDSIKGSESNAGARGYLPPRVQRECLANELRDFPNEHLRLEHLDARLKSAAEPEKAWSAGKHSSHKVRLVLRLR